MIKQLKRLMKPSKNNTTIVFVKRLSTTQAHFQVRRTVRDLKGWRGVPDVRFSWVTWHTPICKQLSELLLNDCKL